MATERKYALTKVKAGDYLLPSNDGGDVIWRMASYVEGPSTGLDWPRDIVVWGLWRWTGETGPGAYVDVEDWNRWEMVDSMIDSRRTAIERAMNLS